MQEYQGVTRSEMGDLVPGSSLDILTESRSIVLFADAPATLCDFGSLGQTVRSRVKTVGTAYAKRWEEVGMDSYSERDFLLRPSRT